MAPIPPSRDPVPADPSVDEAILGQLRELGGPEDPDFLPGLVREFLAHLERVGRGLTEALAAGDGARLGELAHGLKGSAGSLGATRLASHCARLDAVARRGVLEGAEADLERLLGEGERVRARFIALLEEGR